MLPTLKLDAEVPLTELTFQTIGSLDQLQPTGQGNPSRLSGDEAKIFDLVARRFLAAFHPAAEYAEVDRTTEMDGELFRTRRKILTSPGWRAVWERKDKEENYLIMEHSFLPNKNYVSTMVILLKSNFEKYMIRLSKLKVILVKY